MKEMDNETTIAIEARSLAGPGGGVQSYTRELIKGIAKRRPLNVIYANTEQVLESPNITEHIVPLGSELFLSSWLHRKVPAALRDIRPNLVHFTKSDVPKKKELPTVVTIYDIIPMLLPDTQSFLRRRYWPGALQRAAQLSNHIITISKVSRDGIVDRLHIDPSKITITHLGIDHAHFAPAASGDVDRIRSTHGITAPYILFVGTRDARKNVSGLIEAFAKIQKDIPHHLVIAGRLGDKQDSTARTIATTGTADRVHVLGKVDYADLPALYTGADLFVWPSVYEGWGFPPIEAMACGTPVISSDGGSLSEAVGDAGIVVPYAEVDIAKRLRDDDFIQRLAHEMLRVLGDSQAQQILQEKGLAHSRKFSWDSLVDQTIGVYDQVLTR